MINLKGIMGIPLLKKSRFTGSDGELRFVLEKQSSEEEGDRLGGICWFGKLCSDATPDEEKITRYFPFDKDGLEQAQVWLNEQVQNGRGIEN